MPSLNVIKHIEECLDSVVNQTLKDIEIICVDAGSTDGTLATIKQYMKQDNRIHLIISDRKSYGYQMNLGMDFATGEYIGIVETDDYVEPGAFAYLYGIAKEHVADFARGTANCFYGTDARFGTEILANPNVMSDSMIVVNPSKHPELNATDTFLWTGIYRAEFIKQIRFHETSGAAFQDISQMFRILMTAKKAVYTDKRIYNYRHGEEEASSYNRNIFKFTREEYQYIRDLVPDIEPSWELEYYKKLWGQTYSNFVAMAISGKYWSNIQIDIDSIKDMLGEGLIKYPELLSDFLFISKEYGDFEISTRKFYDNLRDDISERRINISEMIDFIGVAGECYIYGAGAWGKFVNRFIKYKLNQNVVGFVDENASLLGTVIDETMVWSLSEIDDKSSYKYIVANKTCSDEIKSLLLENDIPEKQIFIYAAGVAYQIS